MAQIYWMVWFLHPHVGGGRGEYFRLLAIPGKNQLLADLSKKEEAAQ